MEGLRIGSPFLYGPGAGAMRNIDDDFYRLHERLLVIERQVAELATRLETLTWLSRTAVGGIIGAFVLWLLGLRGAL